MIWDFEDLSSRLTRGAAELLEYQALAAQQHQLLLQRLPLPLQPARRVRGQRAAARRRAVHLDAADAAQRLADCAELGTTPLCAASSLANNARGLSLNAATFVISANSPMYQELLRTHRTRFELSPHGADAARSAELGSFVLWNPLNMQEGWDMRVIGFYLGFPDLVACPPTSTEIRHTGLGYQGDSMVMRPPISERPTIVSRARVRRKSTTGWRPRPRADAADDQRASAREAARLRGRGIMPFLAIRCAASTS